MLGVKAGLDPKRDARRDQRRLRPQHRDRDQVSQERAARHLRPRLHQRPDGEGRRARGVGGQVARRADGDRRTRSCAICGAPARRSARTRTSPPSCSRSSGAPASRCGRRRFVGWAESRCACFIRWATARARISHARRMCPARLPTLRSRPRYGPRGAHDRRERSLPSLPCWPSALPLPAQDFPDAPCGSSFRSAAGGGGDVFTRALADELQKAWGQPVVVENRPGGALNIGTRACAEAAPDGYTICVLSSEPAVYNQFLFKSIPYDPEKDFAADRQSVLQHARGVANTSLKVKTIAEMIALAKASPASSATPRSRFRPRISWRSSRRRAAPTSCGCPTAAAARWSPRCCRHHADRGARAVQHGAAAAERPHHAARGHPKARSPLFPDVPTLGGGPPGEDYPTTWFGLFTPAGVPGRSSRRSPRRRLASSSTALPQAHVHRPRRRAGARAAGGLRPLHQRGPQGRGADRRRIGMQPE